MQFTTFDPYLSETRFNIIIVPRFNGRSNKRSALLAWRQQWRTDSSLLVPQLASESPGASCRVTKLAAACFGCGSWNELQTTALSLVPAGAYYITRRRCQELLNCGANVCFWSGLIFGECLAKNVNSFTNVLIRLTFSSRVTLELITLDNLNSYITCHMNVLQC